MKKSIWILIVLLLMTACSSNSVSKDEKVKIGVLQLMEHEALSDVYRGFKDALNDNGYTDVIYEYQNPNNDNSVLPTMAQYLVNQDCDLILAIGTNSAQALGQETSEIAILGSAITDYVDVGLIKSNEKPGGNISGASDFVEMSLQMDLIAEFVPDVKTVGLLYTSSEENSIIQAEAMKKECEKRGWSVVEKTISDLTMVNDAMLSFQNEIDALYIPTDNPLASSMASVDIVAKENNIPVFTGWDAGVRDGALASIGVNYYNLGYQTGLQAIQILSKEVNIEDLPIYFMDSDNVDIYYNSKTASQIGITVPENIKTKGKDLSQ